MTAIRRMCTGATLAVLVTAGSTQGFAMTTEEIVLRDDVVAPVAQDVDILPTPDAPLIKVAPLNPPYHTWDFG